MKVIDAGGPIRLAVVCGVHGDEHFGQRVYQRLASELGSLAGLRLVLANEEALVVGQRFLESDLNRCFPGRPDGDHEERLAAGLLPVLREAEMVLDIHTTTSRLVMTPIVASLNPVVRQVLNNCASAEVVYMPRRIARQALIGQLPVAVSLEFNQRRATRPEVLEDLVAMIRRLLRGEKQAPRRRRVFRVTRTIPRRAILPQTVANFRRVRAYGFYPFLPNGKSYSQHRGFAADRYEEMSI